MKAFMEAWPLITPRNYNKERLWATSVKHPDPQILAPGNTGEACVVFDPGPADVEAGTAAEFAITAFLAGRMIGGVNAIITKK